MSIIKILSWNIEHFKSDKQDEVAAIIKGYNPDIFGIYEVEANSVYPFMKENFPNHIIFLTTGQQRQEILVGIRNKPEHIGVKFQQKEKFKSGNPGLRPGAFLTFEYKGKGQYNFLFLHTDSGTSAVDVGNRTEMFEHAYNLKRKLDYDARSKVNFIMLGDLNTMGLNYPRHWKSDRLFETTEELKFLDFYANRSCRTYRGGQKGKYKKEKPKVRRLTKPSGTYYNKSIGISDLDHIIASDHLEFVQQDNYGESKKADIRLDGWRQHMGNEQKMNAYVAEISDHCLLYCELQL